MNATDMFTNIRYWVNLIINTENSKNYTIIQSNQNAPRPSGTYIVLHKPLGHQKFGRGNFGYADNTGKVLFSHRYIATMTIEEVNGTGDSLRLLVNSIGRQDIHDYFYSKKMSIANYQVITPSNELSEDLWEDRAMIDFSIVHVDESNYSPSYISTVEFEGTYNNTWDDFPN